MRLCDFSSGSTILTHPPETVKLAAGRNPVGRNPIGSLIGNALSGAAIGLLGDQSTGGGGLTGAALGAVGGGLLGRKIPRFGRNLRTNGMLAGGFTGLSYARLGGNPYAVAMQKAEQAKADVIAEIERQKPGMMRGAVDNFINRIPGLGGILGSNSSQIPSALQSSRADSAGDSLTSFMKNRMYR